MEKRGALIWLIRGTGLTVAVVAGLSAIGTMLVLGTLFFSSMPQRTWMEWVLLRTLLLSSLAISGACAWIGYRMAFRVNCTDLQNFSFIYAALITTMLGHALPQYEYMAQNATFMGVVVIGSFFGFYWLIKNCLIDLVWPGSTRKLV